MGFNSAFKGLNPDDYLFLNTLSKIYVIHIYLT